jgi:hypothetical protein
MISACRAAILLSLASLTGCATVIDGHTQSVSVETLKDAVTSVPASCVVSNKQGSWTVTTPGEVTVDRGRGVLNLACTAPGYLPATTAVQATGNQDEQGNLIIGGAVGMLVDYSDGAAYAYPGQIIVPMRPVPAPVASAPAPVPAAPAAPAKS